MNQEFELDFSSIFSAIAHWFLLILFFMIVGGTLAIVYNYGAPIKYQSETTLYIQPQVNSSVVDYQGILTNQRMVETYAEIIKSRTVMNKTIEKLELEVSYDEFEGNISVTPSSDTQMIKITVKDEDKILACDIANSLAESFIEQIKDSMDVTNITVVDEAIVGEEPVEPNVTKNLVIGVGAGLLLSLVLVFIIESMNNKIKTHEDVKKYLKIKTLGVIPHNSIDNEIHDKKKVYIKPGEGNIKIISDPKSVISESVRIIRTNLNFLDLKLINVTSTVPSEGKTEAITNLAASFAMLDKRVLVIDCDLRKPKIHKTFGLPRNFGVADVVLSKGMLDYKRAVQTYTKENVSIDVLTAGSKISNPSELINNKGFANLLKQVREDYDLVLIDCPPISSMTDGVLVSKLSDGTVYVIESNRTDYPIVADCIEQLQTSKAFILGAILTKVDVKREKKIYGYKYDYYYSNYGK